MQCGRKVGARLTNAAILTAFAVLVLAGFAGCKLTGETDDEDDGGNKLPPNAAIGFLKAKEGVIFTDETYDNLEVTLMNGVLDIADLRWTSTDNTVVAIPADSDNQATITLTPQPQKVGTVTITATLTPKNDEADAALSNYTLSDTFSLTILDIPVVTVNTIGQIMLNADGTPRAKQISAASTLDPLAYPHVYTWEITEGGDYAELPAVTGDDVMLRGKQAGSGKVKATLKLLERNFASAEADWSVIDFDTTQEPHQSITISGAPSTMIATDTSAEFSLAFTPDTASYSSIDWVYDGNKPLSDKFIINGADSEHITLTAKANSVGSYTIEAKSRLDENVKASFNLTVNALVVTVNVASNKSTSISKNETTTYTASFNSQQSKSVSWSAADSKVTVTSATGDIKNTESVTANTDVTITATVTGTSFTGSKTVRLTPPTYTLAYNANGGSGTAMTNESKTYGVPYTLTQNTYTKTNYRFTGWNSAANGSGTAYTDKQANVNIDPSAKGATVTLYAQWQESDVVAGQEGNPDLMVKFGVKSAGYAIGDISAQDVTDTFNKVSAYIKTQSASSVNPSTGLGVIQMGDYVNLKSLNVTVYNSNPAVSITNTNTGNDKLRVMVVGINSYYNKNSNGTTTPHLIFHFKGVPGDARMEATDTNANGYLGSEMRTYITSKYWPALQTAGVSDAVVWPVSRRVANGGSGATTADTITDKLWLPTEWELFGSNSSSSSTYETSANQGRLGYYNDNAARIKSGYYWAASPRYSSTSSFCGVNAGGYASGVYASAVGGGGCAPAFCVK
ncbi:MAG: hypothetical protein Pg6A_16610 [Termitinemataceae bacterium]|nr:MAG: hypothetical protein Pg6A_16610 [Termitinemataceae bacterium]